MYTQIKLPPCVVMAGGLGTRLGAITKHKPKSALKIKEQPFIYHKLNNLVFKGFDEFIFLLSYKNEMLINLINKYAEEKKIKCYYIVDKKREGTFKAISNAHKDLPKIFFYTNGDEISKVNYMKMYEKFIKNNYLLLSLIKKQARGNLQLHKENLQLSEDFEKVVYKELGCKFINKEIFKFVDKNYNKFEDLIYQTLTTKTKVGYFLSNEIPLRIDTPLDIKITNIKIR